MSSVKQEINLKRYWDIHHEMTTKKNIYNLYIYHNDVYLGKYKTVTNNLQKLSKDLSEDIIRDGMKRGFKINQQIQLHTHFADIIAKQRENCQKIRASDLRMLIHSQMSLYRFGSVPSTNFLFLKKK